MSVAELCTKVAVYVRAAYKIWCSIIFILVSRLVNIMIILIVFVISFRFCSVRERRQTCDRLRVYLVLVYWGQCRKLSALRSLTSNKNQLVSYMNIQFVT